MEKKKPCSDCPFRKNATPGWLGAHKDATEIIDLVYQDQYFPCHMEVNKLMNNGKKFGVAVFEAPFCVGALQFMNNSIKRSRDREVAKLQDEAGKNDDVFPWRKDMEEHHGRGPLTGIGKKKAS